MALPRFLFSAKATFQKIPATLKEAAQQLLEYLTANAPNSISRINPKGTDFSKSLAGIVANPIWQDRLLYGHHQKLGDVKAIRAVASANGKTFVDCGSLPSRNRNRRFAHRIRRRFVAQEMAARARKSVGAAKPFLRNRIGK
jgi:hypothetical protein